jgi:hypothetical protein
MKKYWYSGIGLFLLIVLVAAVVYGQKLQFDTEGAATSSAVYIVDGQSGLNCSIPSSDYSSFENSDPVLQFQKRVNARAAKLPSWDKCYLCALEEAQRIEYQIHVAQIMAPYCKAHGYPNFDPEKFKQEFEK